MGFCKDKNAPALQLGRAGVLWSCSFAVMPFLTARQMV